MNQPNDFASLSYKDLSRVALYLGNKLLSEYCKELKVYWHRQSTSEHFTLSLAIWKALCELKEFGELRTRPEDLIRRATINMREYQCRGYSPMLTLLSRAFVRQFTDFDNLPEIKNFSLAYDRLRFYAYGDEPCIKKTDQFAHKILVKTIPSYEKFGKYVVCEEWPHQATEVAGIGMFIVNEWGLAVVVPFETRDEAVFFLVQLVDLLNTEGEPDCPAAAQFIRETVANAPIEKMRIEEERQAAERAAREVEERRRAEKERQAAFERAKREETMRDGVHVYALELDNNTCKIGISNNVRRRINEVQSGGNTVTRFAVTQEGYKCGKARRIEWECHQFFKDKLKPGQREYFFISFDEAKAQLETYGPVFVEEVTT